MTKTITQSITFKNTSVEKLFSIYMDRKKHSAATGGEAKINSKVGTSFSAWDGYINGKNLQIVKNVLIVQTWRSADFSTSDTDSIFMLAFEKKGKNAVVHMVHGNIPEHQYEGLKKGWNDFYWKPWKKYLAKN